MNEHDRAENRCFEIGHVWMQGCQTCLENKVRAEAAKAESRMHEQDSTYVVERKHLCEIAEDVYFVRTGSVSVYGIAAVVDAIEPIVRADERERIVAELSGPAQESEAMYAHAEAVAAKLVEVIRVDDLRLRTHKAHAQQARRERDAARDDLADSRHWAKETVIALAEVEQERDAARAEVAALRREESAVIAERDRTIDALHAEVAALREDVRHWEAVADGEARR